MAKPSARRTAIAALRTWRADTRFADSIISKLFAETQLTVSDRAFALELFYGVLRNLTLLDFWIDCLRPAATDADLRDILRVGLYQLFCLKTPEHAAVYETVELAPKRGRTLINGVLRTATRQQNQLRTRAEDQPLFIRMSHPPFLVKRWEQNFGAKAAESLCAWNNEPPPIYGRINRLKIERDTFLGLNSNSTPFVGNPDFVQFDAFPAKALAQGHCYIQDPSTIIPCQLLDPQPDENILDACAAPGGKTGYIAELMKNSGRIMACDRAPERVSIVEENIGRLGVNIVRTLCQDWEIAGIAKEILSAAPFDRILIDAPCSNTGVMRRRVDVRWRLKASDFERMQNRQVTIVRAIVPLLKPGGALVYGTCSLEHEENEAVLERILAELPSLELREKKKSLPFRDNLDGAFAAKFIRNS